jgi:hypothetical protein
MGGEKTRRAQGLRGGKPMMIRNAAAALFLLLSACTGITTYHNACMDMPAPFAQQVDCVKANVAQNSALASDTLVQEYLATGDLLVSQVRSGEMSEDKARLLFIQKLNDMKRAEAELLARQAEAQRSWDRQWPFYTDCYRSGADMHCRSY